MTHKARISVKKLTWYGLKIVLKNKAKEEKQLTLKKKHRIFIKKYAEYSKHLTNRF